MLLKNIETVIAFFFKLIPLLPVKFLTSIVPLNSSSPPRRRYHLFWKTLLSFNMQDICINKQRTPNKFLFKNIKLFLE